MRQEIEVGGGCAVVARLVEQETANTEPVTLWPAIKATIKAINKIIFCDSKKFMKLNHHDIHSISCRCLGLVPTVTDRRTLQP